MNKRTTNVDCIEVNSLSYSSIFNIGDCKYIDPKVDAIAVQKQGGVKSDAGFTFDQYPIFKSELKFLSGGPLNQTHTHYHKQITVPYINITAASSSSIIHLGNVDDVCAKTRTKHIRILESE
jgi:spore germination protein PE